MNIFDKKQKNKFWREKLGRSYFNTHNWMYKTYGKADHCSNDKAHTSVHFEWANISKEYKRELSDWKQLCIPCHRSMDYSKKQKQLASERIKGKTYASKPVKQFDKDGLFIKQWESARAVNRELGIIHTAISNALSGRTKTAGGYIWEI